MKKMRGMALLLLIAMALSLWVPPVQAANPGSPDTPKSDNGLTVNKYVTGPDGSGQYTIRLEAYATGSTIITQKTEPVDIILVLDQSGSMADPFASADPYISYGKRTNSRNYSNRHNNNGFFATKNLWYKRDDDSYVEVSVTREDIKGYHEFSPFNPNNKAYYAAQPLYVKVGNEYEQIIIERDISNWLNYKYTYKFPDGSIVNSERESLGYPDFGDRVIYDYRTVDYSYTYSYTIANQTTTIVKSDGANTVCPTEFYQKVSDLNRMEALKSAVKTFVDSVSASAIGPDGKFGTSDDVNHRIAVVGFASDDSNTEILSTTNEDGEHAIQQYSTTLGDGFYERALQDMDTVNGQQIVNDSIDALATNGATRIDLGMVMAQNILAKNQPTDNRKRIVVAFTDGSPTANNGFEARIANAALEQSKEIKKTATVYAVGIFDGADASSSGTPPTSSTNPGDNTLIKWCNWFMQNLSNNKGKPQDPSYYLSANNTNALNNIFQQIGDQVSGGSHTELGSSAVIKDIIAPSFVLPKGADLSQITLQTVPYTGENQWGKAETAAGVTAKITGSEGAQQVSVEGFDFEANYVGTHTDGGSVTYVGKKLVISFPVKVRPGFLGGNNVPTNTSAGIYANSDATEPVIKFPVPTVDVPIAVPEVTAPDLNVYLLADVTADQLKNGVTATTNTGAELDFSKTDYGLDPWQHEYVNINHQLPTADFTDLPKDTTYTASVTITPKYEGTGQKTSGEATGKINVFKPELTFADSEVWYGDTAPDDYSGNLEETQWKHGETAASSVNMTDEAPALTLTYAPKEGMIKDGKINTKQDIPVDVTVSMQVDGESKDVTEYTTFEHQVCSHEDCTWDGSATGGEPAFLLHVNTCSLTITKTGGATGEPYVFTIQKDGDDYTQVTIVGNDFVKILELPVGKYTVTEDTGWAWRYESTFNPESVELSADVHEATITCTNEKKDDHWLNEYSAVVKNIYEPAKP